MAAGALLATLSLVAAVACGDSGNGDDDSFTAIREQAPPDSIAFGAQEGEGVPPNGGTYGLYLVRPDGTFLRSIQIETAPVSSPVWAPTGDRIAYNFGADAARLTATLRIYDFASQAATTVSDSALTSDVGPAMSWSADGGRLAFAEEGGRIRIYDADRAVLEDAGGATGLTPAWRPGADELAIARVSGNDSGSSLSVLAADGDDERELLEREAADAAPVWSPDGESLAFQTLRPDVPGRFVLSVLQIDNGSLTEVGPGSGAAWSPDGAFLTYYTLVSDASPDIDIFVAPAGGGPPRAFAGPATLDVAPSWSPDGGRIVYLARADRTTAFICLVALEGEDRDCLDLPGLLPSQPAWSPH